MDYVLTCGRFDILHPGHISLFRYCSTKGMPVFVGINSDESCQALGKPAVMKQTDRFILVSSCKFVSIVFIFSEPDAREMVRSIPVSPKIWIIGEDHKNEDFSNLPCPVEFFPRENYSSSEIKRRIMEQK